MSKKQKEIIILKDRSCMDCGKSLEITLDKKTKKILSGDWYYGKHRFGIGEWAYSRMVTNSDGSIKCSLSSMFPERVQ
jgi:hypothetical protein